MSERIESTARATALRESFAGTIGALGAHRVYSRLDSIAAVRTFMEHHAFAVLDFMSLLKALQVAFTDMHVPWAARGEPRTRRFLNEIVLREESDEADEGRSHFESYRLAMEQAGADTAPVDDLVRRLRAGEPPLDALAAAPVPRAARAFVATTWRIVAGGRAHAIAAAFAIGREEAIPAMFGSVLASLDRAHGGALARFRRYLDRHVQLDGDEHGPLALRLLAIACGDDDEKWEDARRAADAALAARAALWDGVANALAASNAAT